MRPLSVAILLGLAACADDEPEPRVYELEMEDQVLDDPGAIEISRVESSEAGFVAIYGIESGARGDLLGVQVIPAGESVDLRVELDADIPQNAELQAVLHRDDGEKGVFENDDDPGRDRPVQVDGQELKEDFAVVISIDVPSLEASDQTPPAADVLRVVRVDLAEPGFVRVVQALGGDASLPEIGVRLLEAGRLRDVDIAIERDLVGGESLFVVLHDDSNDNGQLDWTGDPESDDPPLRDGADEVVQVQLSITSTRAPSESILVRNQEAASSTASVELVSLIAAEAGFIAIYDEELIPPPLATATVAAGLSALVEIDVPLGNVSGDFPLKAVLHRDSDEDGIFDYDGGEVDPPARGQDDAIIEADFIVRRLEQ